MLFLKGSSNRWLHQQKLRQQNGNHCLAQQLVSQSLFIILIKCYILKYSAILKNKLLKSPGESNHESLVSAKKDCVTAFLFILLIIELEKLLINQTKSQLLVGQKCLLSIISNVTNNEINFKTTIAIRFDLLQVCRLLLYLLFYLYLLLIF